MPSDDVRGVFKTPSGIGANHRQAVCVPTGLFAVTQSRLGGSYRHPLPPESPVDIALPRALGRAEALLARLGARSLCAHEQTTATPVSAGTVRTVLVCVEAAPDGGGQPTPHRLLARATPSCS